jgi:ABC-type nitrate/sulfonate/bicarbonate transport system substrate-binding protein
MSVALDYGVPTNRSGLNIHFGVERGFFAEENIDLTVRVIYGGPEIAAAYDSGDLKIGELGTPPGVTAIGHGKRFKIIGSGFQRGVGLFFLAGKGISDWNDLRAKTVGALSIGSCSYWYLRELLTQHDIDPDRDLTIRGLGPDYPRQLELFAKDEIVGLLSPEPNGALGEADGVLSNWGDVLSLADVPKLQWIIQVANQDFLRSEPEVVRRVLRAAQRATRYLGEHPDELIAYTAQFYGIPHRVAAVAVRRELPFLHFDGQLDHAGLEQAIALQHRLGAIGDRLPAQHFVADGFQPAPASRIAEATK